MVDITAISGAMTSLKVMKDITETMIGLRDAAAFQEKRVELQSKIIDIQSSMFLANEERVTLVESVSELKKEITALTAWDADKEKHELTAVHVGAFAFMVKPAMRGSEPAHWLCPTCFEQRKKRILYLTPHRSPGLKGGTNARWQCFECSTQIDVSWNVTPDNPWSGRNSSAIGTHTIG